MRFLNRKPEDDQVHNWLCGLQERFALSDKEAGELYALTHTCFAHNFGVADVKRVIYCYISKLGRKLEPNDIEADSVFTHRAGSRRYGKWSWQESAFGICAYLLTIFFFLLDISTYSWDPSVVACNQFVAVLVVLTIWVILDKWLRGRPWTTVLFNAVNRFMPGLTLVVYIPFHLCKMYFLQNYENGWLWGMKAVVVVYVVLGVLLTVINLLRYRKAIAFVK